LDPEKGNPGSIWGRMGVSLIGGSGVMVYHPNAAGAGLTRSDALRAKRLVGFSRYALTGILTPNRNPETL